MAKFKAPKKNKLKISACYIVKNAAEDLKVSLQSLKKIVDEIIVVDTGSSDETVEVAESFGAKIFVDMWHDDFSDPRNIALKNSSGNWIVFPDADEYFTAETAKNLRAIIERADSVKKTGLLVNLVNIDKDNGNKILDSTYVLRIFKKLPGIRYVGKIHEELRIGKKNLSDVVFVPANLLTIYHTGYSASLSRSKAERNLKMLLAELEETDEPQRVYAYIAECYSGLEDYENAEKFARLDIESGKKNTTFASISYRIILNILAKDTSRLADRKKFAALAAENFSDLPEFHAELAECFAAEGNYKNAIETMTKALEKFKNYKGVDPSLFDASMANFAEKRIKLWQTRLTGE